MEPWQELRCAALAGYPPNNSASSSTKPAGVNYAFRNHPEPASLCMCWASQTTSRSAPDVGLGMSCVSSFRSMVAYREVLSVYLVIVFASVLLIVCFPLPPTYGDAPPHVLFSLQHQVLTLYLPDLPGRSSRSALGLLVFSSRN
jgi:hypothetical protein